MKIKRQSPHRLRSSLIRAPQLSDRQAKSDAFENAREGRSIKLPLLGKLLTSAKR
jgi:hypothetical protein